MQMATSKQTAVLVLTVVPMPFAQLVHGAYLRLRARIGSKIGCLRRALRQGPCKGLVCAGNGVCRVAEDGTAVCFVALASIPLVPNAWSMRSRHRLVPTSIAVVTGFVYLPHRTKPYVSVTLGTFPMVKTASVPHVKVLPAAVMVLVKSTTGMKPRVFVEDGFISRQQLLGVVRRFL